MAVKGSLNSVRAHVVLSISSTSWLLLQHRLDCVPQDDVERARKSPSLLRVCSRS